MTAPTAIYVNREGRVWKLKDIRTPSIAGFSRTFVEATREDGVRLLLGRDKIRVLPPEEEAPMQAS